ncbi:fumarate dihydroorotate dehydrogenase [Parastagonospora nodorum]|nr:fumarate dihydroorotate dehydrogenase [Parastagonospora nodorum]QRD00042.1 fumarate dihydroorotate dehydrogenase [Parastagonospora nodorum SN15]KAH3933708.1 fumarate dihydroorotate dehydrogenase [Parastagonospora nodorum]KAH3952832.1 fumarate dihydroorotate dehydrogenase [Parastagonospora nodorum]KAH3979704.1 fumarate dihydroorotate dehydrogenase [Parastagonospora nodorum]
MKALTISPPLLNSSNPWCTSLAQLQELYDCPHTGAVTTRTSLLKGFPHNSSVHQFAFFNPRSLSASETSQDKGGTSDQSGSLNTLGYSPTSIREYLEYIRTISDGLKDLNDGEHRKPFIISVTGSEEDVVECYKLISAHQKHVQMALAMEVNLSCPNIVGKPPPAYSSTSLLSYLTALKGEIGKQLKPLQQSHPHGGHVHVPIGIKTPPYTYHDQFQAMIDALLESAKAEPKHLPCPVSFITATNTLGSSLLLTPQVPAEGDPAQSTFEATIKSANETGIGGLAGTPLHPLALGNVYTIRGMLFQHDTLSGIQIIGVGGVEDVHGFDRMRAVGAAAVGVGTALGRKGVDIFAEIAKGPESKS